MRGILANTTPRCAERLADADSKAWAALRNPFPELHTAEELA
ncbi:MAG: hypothetical protein U5R46_04735 [Gammaproteobacteria bacterium]|nr:hypothetical protein [Gammaproteobacteria bacterium]